MGRSRFAISDINGIYVVAVLWVVLGQWDFVGDTLLVCFILWAVLEWLETPLCGVYGWLYELAGHSLPATEVK